MVRVATIRRNGNGALEKGNLSMQQQLEQTLPASTSDGALQSGAELWRGSWVIFTKHMHKFVRNGQEVGGTLAAPLLLATTFGLGMEKLVATETIDGLSYLSFITAGIIAFTALSGAINAGMTILEEKIKGMMKEYMVAPIPRVSILLAAAGSGLVKTVVQSMLIVVAAMLFGARLQTSAMGVLAALSVLVAFVVTCVGFANAMALRSKSIGGYHTILFLLNLPLLFLSSALYPLDTMPGWMRVIALLNPTTYAVEGMRAALFGSDALNLALCLAVLSGCAALCTWFSVRTFQRVVQ
jgi:ABC-2 type transport system permease protein